MKFHHAPVSLYIYIYSYIYIYIYILMQNSSLDIISISSLHSDMNTGITET